MTEPVDPTQIDGSPGAGLAPWPQRLEELGRRVRRAGRHAMQTALERAGPGAASRPVGQGAGDATFELDRVTERVVEEWLWEVAADGPLSLLTEDAGWRHAGPGTGEPVSLQGFDHGGPRIAIDPVDGTRHLMADLRSAWTVIGLAAPGAEVPRLSDVIWGFVGELPDSRARAWRSLTARRGQGCRSALRELEDDTLLQEGELRANSDDRADHGYFPFFAFHPDLRTEVARLAANFFARLLDEEGAELAHCYDDQYISSGGQLVLTAMGTYRMVVEARALLAQRRGRPTQVCKPYDVCGAVLCAREAGCVVLGLDGEELDVPLDVSTPVCFAAFANEGTYRRLWRHLQAALRE